jgi:hypothetical protein
MGGSYDKFVIECYGERFDEMLIVPTDVAPQLIVVIELISGERTV